MWREPADLSDSTTLQSTPEERENRSAGGTRSFSTASGAGALVIRLVGERGSRPLLSPAHESPDVVAVAIIGPKGDQATARARQGHVQPPISA